MMEKTLASLAAAVAALALTACSEKPQMGTGISTDKAPYAGTGRNFTQSGWTQGDKASWESQLKARQQYGQNEYSRSPSN